MFRLPPSVAQWVTAVSVGALFSAMLRVSTQESGAAPAALASTAAALVVLAAVAIRRPAAPAWHRPLLGLPVVLHLNAESIRGALVDFGWAQSLPTQIVSTAWGTLWLLALWPTARIAATGLRRPLSGASSIAWAVGLVAGTTHTEAAIGLAAVGLLVADSVHPYEKQPRSGDSPQGWHWANGAAGLLLVGGWVQLRTVFDPTVFGLVVTAAGFALGMAWMPRMLSRNIAWAGTVTATLVAFHHGLSVAAPQLASLGFNNALGWPPLLWLSLPLAAWGVLCGSLVSRTGVRSPVGLGLLAIGGLVGPSALTYSNSAVVAGVLLGVAALIAPTALRRGVAMTALAALVGFHGWLPSPDGAQMRQGIWANSSSPRAFAEWRDGVNVDERFQHGSTPDGTFVAWAAESGDDDATVVVDGLRASTVGNEAAAEEFTAHLAAFLSPRKEPTLVLNDPAGNALRGLAAHPDRITHVAASAAGAIRAIASVDPVRHRLWLQTHHILHPAHGARLLAMAETPSTIIEISRAPWADGTNAELNAEHIEAVKRRLASDGLYALCMHTRWWPEGGPASVALALAGNFEHVQLWLPPEGVDSLILLGSNQPLEPNQLRARFASATTALESLGFRTAEAILGSVLLGTEGVKSWSQQAAQTVETNRLNGAIFDKPILHAGAIPGWMEQHPEPWSEGSSPEARQVRSARRALLAMIQSAASGQIDGTFEAASQLSSEFGDAGQQSLEDLIAPYLRDARQAMTRARSEGSDSEHWNDAFRFVTTARMLAPKSALPLTVEGDIALARGDVPKARQKFESALAIDAQHVPALEGLARCARLSNDAVQAEQALRDATRHSPRDWRTWHNLGVFFLEQGDIAKARDAIELAIPLSGEDKVASLLVLVTILLDLNESGAALLRAEQCVTLAPKNGLAWYLRGRAHYELGRWQEAEADFREAVLLDAGLIEARSGIGLVRAVLGDSESATNVFRDILQRDPDNSAARENLRRLSASQGSP